MSEGARTVATTTVCDALPSACHRQAVEEHGAAGLVSYNSNQVSAWWRDDQNLIVNFIDGVRTVREIRDAVSGEFEPIELALVVEDLDLLAKAGAVTFKR
jgi:hypothetical protein